ncbi:CocE/NonD family hydrolase [Nocardia sp. 2]|uniref:CocE/NonD family hydrolase n=1 Tax=Nocardia acididurans TaxID=2802282 RepID=A0ABS1M4Z8_9NOCA|nr:CocE/NonD family hydrolase [Nocardia acididurans]MBL1075274.1 CocE/NonD family hydrolase [Nocardia acididurans]
MRIIRQRRRKLLPISAIAVSAVVLGLLVAPGTAPAETAPDGGALAHSWVAAHDGPAKYPGRYQNEVFIDFDVPIVMSDGTVLKANIYRPVDANGNPVTTPLPTIVNLTPYTKFASWLADVALSVPALSDALLELVNRIDLTGTPLESITDLTRVLSGGAARTFGVDRKLIQQGYTQVVVDTRGTGYSQGSWQFFQDRENLDTVEVIDWASRQPWSDGNIGMNGISYSGINQYNVAALNPPALKAIFPVEGSTDTIDDVAAPGGGLGLFAPVYILGVDALQFLGDPAAMLLGHLDFKWLLDRVTSPVEFLDYMLMALVPDISMLPEPLRKALEPGSQLREAFTDSHPENIQVPTFAYGGWQDIFTSSSAMTFDRIPLPATHKKLVMGDTYHANPGSGLGNPGAPPRLDVLQMAWFDKWLKGIDNGIDEYGPVVMKQQGGGWISTGLYPRTQDTEYRRMYLSPVRSGTANSIYDGSLTADVPEDTAQLTVSPATGLTSLCSREAAVESAGAMSILPFCAKDDRIHELGGLTFTSAPVVEPTTISGPINVHLNTLYDTTEGYWAVTVNDVAPDGFSTMIASGQLTASLRAVDEEKSSRDADGDLTETVYQLLLDTRQPLVPGVATALDVGVNPTEAVLKPGHRVRINVYASNFPRGMLLPPVLVESRVAPQHLVLDPNEPSFVNLPLSRAIG